MSLTQCQQQFKNVGALIIRSALQWSMVSILLFSHCIESNFEGHSRLAIHSVIPLGIAVMSISYEHYLPPSTFWNKVARAAAIGEADRAQMLLWLSLDAWNILSWLFSVFTAFVQCLMFIMILLFCGLGLFWEPQHCPCKRSGQDLKLWETWSKVIIPIYT